VLVLALALPLATTPARAGERRGAYDGERIDPLVIARDAQRRGNLDVAWDAVQALVVQRSGPGAAADARLDDRIATYRQLERIAREAGRLEALDRLLHEQLRRGRDVATVEWTIGRTLVWRGRFAEALPHLERAVVLAPERLEGYLDLVDCRLALGHRQLDWLDALRERVGHRGEELAARATLLMANGLPHEAAALLDEAARILPASPEVERLRGQVALRLGALDRARAHLDTAAGLAAALPPGSHRARRALLDLLEVRSAVDAHAGRDDRALSHLDAADAIAAELVDRAREARVLAERGIILARQSRLDAAHTTLNQAMALARQVGDDRALRSTLIGLSDADLDAFDTRAAMERLRAILNLAASSGDERDIEAALYRLGNASVTRGEYLEALPYYAEASERAERAGAAVVQQEALVGAARTRIMLSEHHRALDLAKLALSLAERIGYVHGLANAHLTVGRAYYRLGLFDSSQEHLTQALEIAERHGFGREGGRADLQLGLVFDALGQYELARNWYRQALERADALGDLALRVDCETQIAQGRLELGDYDAALDGFEQALERATEAGYLEGRWSNLTHTGEVYRYLGDHGRAAGYFREALRLSTKIGNRVAEATNLEHLGGVYTLFGDHRRALTYLDRSLATSRETGSVIGEGRALLAICRTLNAVGDHAAAEQRCGNALSFAEQHGDVAGRAQSAVGLGNALLGLGRPGRAEPYFETARRLAGELRRPALMWPAEDGLSRALADQGETEPATAMARQAVDTLERLRSGLDRPEKRAGFLEDRLRPYEQLVVLLVRQGMLAEAFQVMEYSRSRAFLEMLNGEQMEAGNGQMHRLRRQELALGREISMEMERLAALPATADRDTTAASILATLRQLRGRLDSIRELLGPQTATEEALTGARPLALDEVQAVLRPDEAILEYYVTRGELITFLITRDRVRAVSSAESAAHLAARVRLLRSTISRPTPAGAEPAWVAPSAGLHQVLLGNVRHDPALGQTDALIIIPHKFLHDVPFHALVDGTGAHARFLIEDYVVSYAPSASVLDHCLERDRGRRESALALANPQPSDLGGTELPYVTSEALAVGYAFGAAAEVRIGADATETVAKEGARGRHVIHFATHYDIDRSDPLSSALDLVPSDRDDGRFEVREVMDLQLDANLVVLSGCFTASGGGMVDQMPESDDWVSLTRAFIYAGAPSVVATLWPVNDRATARLMSRFYELLPFHTKGETLCLAQRELLASLPGDSDRDPYYWAPFLLVGSAR
jgi:CHAT domain-containing protein/tetratricopeptide (TPR) repeat protein